MCMNAPPDALSGGQRNDAAKQVAKPETSSVHGAGLDEPTHEPFGTKPAAGIPLQQFANPEHRPFFCNLAD